MHTSSVTAKHIDTLYHNVLLCGRKLPYLTRKRDQRMASLMPDFMEKCMKATCSVATFLPSHPPHSSGDSTTLQTSLYTETGSKKRGFFSLGHVISINENRKQVSRIPLKFPSTAQLPDISNSYHLPWQNRLQSRYTCYKLFCRYL